MHNKSFLHIEIMSWICFRLRAHHTEYIIWTELYFQPVAPNIISDLLFKLSIYKYNFWKTKRKCKHPKMLLKISPGITFTLAWLCFMSLFGVLGSHHTMVAESVWADSVSMSVVTPLQNILIYKSTYKF